MGRTLCNPIEVFVDRICGTTFLETVERQALLQLPSTEIRLRSSQDVPICRDGDEPIRILKAGVVGHYLQTRDGRRQYAAIYLPGDACNLDALVSHQATKPLCCLGPATIIQVNRRSLQRACVEYPGIAEAFWRHTVGELARATELISSLARLTAEARVARFFIEMAHRTGALFDPVCTFVFPLTQAQLSEAVGLTPVHTNRIIRRLAEAGLICPTRYLMTITDVDALVRMAEIDSGAIQNVPSPMRISECVTSPRQRRGPAVDRVDLQ